MKIKAKLKKLSNVLIDLMKVIFITFVIGRFVTPGIISDQAAIMGCIIAIIMLTFAIIMTPEEEMKK